MINQSMKKNYVIEGFQADFFFFNQLNPIQIMSNWMGPTSHHQPINHPKEDLPPDWES